MGTGLFAQVPLDGDTECSFIIIGDDSGLRIDLPKKVESTYERIHQQIVREKEERLRKEQGADRLNALKKKE